MLIVFTSLDMIQLDKKNTLYSYRHMISSVISD